MVTTLTLAMISNSMGWSISVCQYNYFRFETILYKQYFIDFKQVKHITSYEVSCPRPYGSHSVKLLNNNHGYFFGRAFIAIIERLITPLFFI